MSNLRHAVLLVLFASSTLMLALSGLTACDDAGPDDASDTTAPDTLTNDTLKPDTLEPDTLEPDTLAPDTLAPDTADTSEPEVEDTADAHDTEQDLETPPPADLPSHAELAEGWNVLWPEGETICSRGTPFGFGVYKGRTDRVVIDFIGGGACWNALTCSANEQLKIFSDTVDDVLAAAENGDIRGIYRHERADNPFADWTHVVIPYCTGDIHWGDSVTTYPSLGGNPPVTIHHKGRANVQAVLDWVYENITEPEKLFVTGCSAGSYGSIMWSAHLMENYPEASVYQFGDSGAGVITDSFFRDSFPSWNAQASFPSWIPALDPARNDILEMELADLYAGIGAAYPTQLLSQFNTRLDENQTFYYTAMGGAGGAQGWSDKMLASLGRIEDSTPGFHAFVADGERHCIIVFDEFYTERVGDTLLVEWLDAMVNDEPISSHYCDDCTLPAP